MQYKPRVGDEIYIKGCDEVFIVELIQQQYRYSNFTYKEEIFYSVRGKQSGKCLEVTEQDIEPKRTEQEIKRKIDELLDTYNEYMRLEEMFKDGDFEKKAGYILEKLKNKNY
jgi:hypothetical protein